MQFTLSFATFFAIIGLFAQLTFALPTAAPAPVAAPAPAADAAAAAAPNPEISALKKRGFGCNGPLAQNDLECHRHCASIAGYKGGYCTKFGFVCKCY